MLRAETDGSGRGEVEKLFSTTTHRAIGVTYFIILLKCAGRAETQAELDSGR